MDAVAQVRPAQAAPPPGLPPDAPLAMPVQDLGRRPQRAVAAPRLGVPLALRRAFVFGGAAALTALAAFEMYKVLDVGGLTEIECAILVLFVVLFAWIGLAFTTALGGAVNLAEADYRAGLIGAGLPEPVAALLADCDAAAAMGALFDDGHALSRLIGRPTTPFAETVAATVSGALVA
jgi:membrane glycosyltransferase